VPATYTCTADLQRTLQRYLQRTRQRPSKGSRDQALLPATSRASEDTGEACYNLLQLIV
jgi:hypothetical protein